MKFGLGATRDITDVSEQLELLCVAIAHIDIGPVTSVRIEREESERVS